MRKDGRKADELRPVEIIRGFTKSAPGSVLIKAGNTKVICTATVTHTVPEFLAGTGKGWITAEYGMLPGSTAQRKQRERLGRVDGRSFEIQRLIGRALRMVVDLELLGEITIWIDCDVIDADGGTRTAGITGAYVALVDAIKTMRREGMVFVREPIRKAVAAVSVGMVQKEILLDLSYEEDSNADVDMNVVMTDKGELVEVQSTAERATFSKENLEQMLKVAEKGLKELFIIQQKALAQE